MPNSIQHIFRQHGSAYLSKYGADMPNVHRRAIYAIQHCGTGRYGNHLFYCNKCGKMHSIDGSCGNRNCPTCQSGKSDEWLDKQMKKSLPVTYFMITFTVPSQLRELIRSNQEVAYKALFKAASQALKTLAKDPRFVGCDIAGFTGVLHTWTRQLIYHPHIHFIVPGGGIADRGQKWKPSGKEFYIHGRPLSIMFRGKFMAELKKTGLQADPVVWKIDWVVDVENVGNGDNALKYLAQYIFRIAIAPSRIINVSDTHITFKYENSKTKEWHTCTLEIFEFLRRYLQHVLPSGFTKVRHYGFLSPNCKISLKRIYELIGAWLKELRERLPRKRKPKTPRPKKPWCCKKCGGIIVWREFVPCPRGTG